MTGVGEDEAVLVGCVPYGRELGPVTGCSASWSMISGWIGKGHGMIGV